MTLHQKITKSLNDFPITTNSKELSWVAHYLGTTKKVLGIRSADIKALGKQYLKLVPSSEKFYQLIFSLYQHGQTYEELSLAATIFGLGKKYRSNFKPAMLADWLSYTVGWAEVDSLCQSNFSALDILPHWDIWKPFLVSLSYSSDIECRRASMVLLNKPLRTSDDSRLRDLAFTQINTLKHEKEILITKAVSWLLRSLVKHHSPELKKYLADNQQSLPKIAYREALKKLTTGKKN